eukprot:TRINITY_DN1480_c0_g3_i7.p1 TRINITY_DN1480_c0_g3~~TRINITY_DN1480_c0_g3_i7.p1  ORF type:complete len:214 (-),score=68.94 TRINITY_DN1480_c0_g3_i7:128-712(-)
MTEYDLEKYSDILASSIQALNGRLPDLTVEEIKEATKQRERRREKEFQEALCNLAESQVNGFQTKQSSFSKLQSFFKSGNQVLQEHDGLSELEKLQHELKEKTESETMLKEANAAIYKQLSKLMDDNTRLILDMDFLMKERKRLEIENDSLIFKTAVVQEKLMSLISTRWTKKKIYLVITIFSLKIDQSWAWRE